MSGNWNEVEEVDGFEALGWTGTLEIVDLDADGSSELVVATADGLRIMEQGRDGQLYWVQLFRSSKEAFADC